MSEEYIRRQDAITEICDCTCGELKDTCKSQEGCSYYDALTLLPPADVVQVVQGEWVRTESFVNGIVTRIYKCSCCDGVAGVRADNGFWYKSNFCPNCGAKMDEKRKKVGETND